MNDSKFANVVVANSRMTLEELSEIELLYKNLNPNPKVKYEKEDLNESCKLQKKLIKSKKAEYRSQHPNQHSDCQINANKSRNNSTSTQEIDKQFEKLIANFPSTTTKSSLSFFPTNVFKNNLAEEYIDGGIKIDLNGKKPFRSRYNTFKNSKFISNYIVITSISDLDTEYDEKSKRNSSYIFLLYLVLGKKRSSDEENLGS